MAIDYAVKYGGQVIEKFKVESKSEAVVNNEFDFVGAKTVAVYNVPTVVMTDYTRSGLARFGTPTELDAPKEEMTMTKDRAFTFTIDKMNNDETAGALEAGKALARQLREVVIPEVDTYRFAKMATLAGTKATTVASIDKTNVYNLILQGQAALDGLEVPSEGRKIIVTPSIRVALMESNYFVASDVTQEQRARGVVGMVDGMEVIQVPAGRLPLKFGFMITHPIACTSPVKLAEYRIHEDVPGISGKLVEGRVYYDAFVLTSRTKAIYIQSLT